MDLSSINFHAVIGAALAAFILGALWYSTPFFGKPWQKELGFTDEYLKQGNMGLIFGTSFVMMLLMSFGLAIIFNFIGFENLCWLKGLLWGLLFGAFFAGTSSAINYLYQRRSFKLWVIDALYQILMAGIMGIVLASWN